MFRMTLGIGLLLGAMNLLGACSSGDNTGGGSSDGGSDGGAYVDLAAPPAPVATTAITRFTDTCVSAPTDYGAYGSVMSYARYELANPAWVGDSAVPVQVAVPIGGAATHPVIFYAHPFGGTDWTRVRSLIEFLVSHDYVVVFTPYATLSVTVCQRYDTLWGGFKTAVEKLGASSGMDTSRLGVMGHSFGGGASPWLMRQALATGWGSKGSFVYANAPWYSYRMTTPDFAALASTRFLLMMFDDDTTNDHRIGISHEWEPWQGPREYIRLPSASEGRCSLVADHVVPSTDGIGGSVARNALDTWGVWRHAQALAACTLRGDTTACSVIDGGAAPEVKLGAWLASGSPVTPAVGTDAPMPIKLQSAYQFPLDDASKYPCSGTGG